MSMANSPMYDDAIDLSAAAKKLTGISSRERNVAGMAAFCLPLISVGLFIASASMIRADRTARIPVVTWGRTAALLALLGAIASVAAGVLAIFAAFRKGRWSGLQALGLNLSTCGAVGFLFYLGSLYEN
jgi:hypothetical protein